MFMQRNYVISDRMRVAINAPWILWFFKDILKILTKHRLCSKHIYEKYNDFFRKHATHEIIKKHRTK
jgi:hypothetical protein